MENYNYNRNDLLFNYWAYIFPKLTNADIDMADREYGLKVLFTPCLDFKEYTALMGTWDNIVSFIIENYGEDSFEKIGQIVYLGKDKEAK